MCAEALAGNAEQASAIDATLTALHNDLFIESNPIPVKWALKRMGMAGSELRLPLVGLSDSSKPIVEQALLSAGIELSA